MAEQNPEVQIVALVAASLLSGEAKNGPIAPQVITAAIDSACEILGMAKTAVHDRQTVPIPRVPG